MAAVVAIAMLPVTIEAIAPSAAEATYPGKPGRILFTTERDGNREIYSMWPDGSGERNVTRAPRFQDLEASVAADGRRIVFTRADQCANRHPRCLGLPLVLMITDSKGRNPREVTAGRHPTVTPDGRLIAFSESFGTTAVHSVKAGGGGSRQLTTGSAALGLEFGPVFAPNGTELLYERADFSPVNSDGYWPDYRHDIWVMSSDGSNKRPLTGANALDREPDISPDGTKVVFTSHCPEPSCVPGYEEDIFVMNADGSGLTNLTRTPFRPQFPGGEGSPVFSPDGSEIAFTRHAGQPGELIYEVWVMNVDGSSKRMIAGPGSYENLAWAPIPPKCAGRRPTMVGTSGPDRLRGTGGRDVISGGGDRDVVRGRGGDDVICGGRSRDRLIGGGGRDRLIGGKGADRTRQ